MAAEKRAQLQQLLPEVFAEGQLDVDKLRLVLGQPAPVGEERYGLSWPGKAAAYRELQRRTTATLVPDRAGSVGFDTAENVFIEGENLEVLRVLQQAYFGQVKMAYIDPPYNTGNDSFVYPDSFQETRKEFGQRTGQLDDEGNLTLHRNGPDNGHYHSAWLCMMLPRLLLSRNLLREDGVIFVSIDDHEVFNLKLLLDEVFGEENFYGCFVWQRRSGAMDSVDNVSTDHEYVLCYGKSKSRLKGIARTFERYANPDNDLRGPWIADNLSAGKAGGDTLYPITDPATGAEYLPPKGRYWPYNRQTMQQKIAEGRVLFPKNGREGSPLLKRFQQEAKFATVPVSTWMRNEAAKGVGNALRAAFNTEGTRQLQELFGDKVFSHPKPTALIKSFASQCLDPEDIVLDYFAGSASTAQAIIELNNELGGKRKFICVQLREEYESGSAGRELGYQHIAQMSKARIQKVLQKLTGGTNLNFLPPEVAGFKAFTLQPSNFKIWPHASAGTEPAEQLDFFENQFVADEPDAESIVYELMLKGGIKLSARVSRDTNGYFWASEEAKTLCVILTNFSDAALENVLARKPTLVAIQERAFADDDQLTNAGLRFKEANVNFLIL